MQERIQGETGGLKKDQAAMLFLLEMKHFKSMPANQARTKPPLEPVGAT